MADINNANRYLFRGKRVDNGEWIDGDLMQNYIHHQGFLTIVQSGCIYHKVDPSTVGQWTGLADKNRVMVFDGDVVFSSNWNPSTYKVAFDRGAFYLSDQNNKEGIPEIFGSVDAKYIDKFEIIGNIHDNPDLLK